MANLSALLEREAGAEIETILSEARARASEIIAKAEEDAKVMTAQRERTSQSQAEAARVRAQSAAQLEASSMKLRAQHKAVEQVFDAAKAELDALVTDKKRFAPVLATLLKDAVAALGGRDQVASVMVNPADEAAARDAAKAHELDAKVEASETVKGGVKVRASSNVTVENSLFDRLESARDDLASEVSKLLGAQAEHAQSDV